MRSPFSAQLSCIQELAQQSTRQQSRHQQQPNRRGEPQIRIPTHVQGEESGLVHDPGERALATARPAGNNMYAPSAAPAAARNEFSRSVQTTKTSTPPRHPPPRINADVQQSSARALQRTEAAERLHTWRAQSGAAPPSRSANRSAPLSPSSPGASTQSKSAVSGAPTLSRTFHPSQRLSTSLAPSYVPQPPGSARRPPPLPSHIMLTTTNTPPHRAGQLAAPAPPSAQTIIHMAGGGTKPPSYIPISGFFSRHGEEQGEERPPEYQTTTPSIPPPAQWMPRGAMGEFTDEMRMEGRQGLHLPRWTMQPSSIPRAANGIGGGTASRREGT